MTVGRICVREVHLVDLEESVREAADRMGRRQVGTLVILDPERKPVGILTDRDLAVRVLAQALDPDATRVRDVMSGGLQAIPEDTPIEDALDLMRAGPYRRLPVVDGDERLVGIVSIDDVTALLAEEFQRIGKLVEGQSPPRWQPPTPP